MSVGRTSSYSLSSKERNRHAGKWNIVDIPLDITNHFGAVYYIGTQGNTVPYVNPTNIEIFLSARSSSDMNLFPLNRLTDRAGTTTSEWYSINHAGAWFIIDFGPFRAIEATEMRIQQYVGASVYHGNLTIAGSNDSVTFTQIGTLTSPTQSSYAWNTATISSAGVAYRYIRVLQSTTNSGGTNYFSAQEVEFFGKLYIER